MGPVPVTLVNALARRRDELHGVRVHQGATRHPLPWARDEPGWEEHLQFVTDFISVLVRPAIESRRGDFAITDYGIGSKVLEAGRQDGWSADVFMALVSEPDAAGHVSFGYSLWHSKALLRAAKLRIAEVGRNVLRTCGDNCVDLSAFDLIVEQVDPHQPVPAARAERRTHRSHRGHRRLRLDAGQRPRHDPDRHRHVVVVHGQLSHREARSGHRRRDPRGLGGRAGQSGVATGRYKTYAPGVATASFIVPGADFDFCADNPLIELRDIEWTNNLPRIAGIRNLVAINQASMIDLTGQVASESIGPVMYTGPGGQLVWTMGALMAPGGRAIHVLPSTARNGTRLAHRRAAPARHRGHRAAHLRRLRRHRVRHRQSRRDSTQRQRAMALIDLAHPDFRDQLRSDARRLFWP